jgi:hemerythrin
MLAIIIEEHNTLERAINSLTRPRDLDNIIKLFLQHTVDEERLMQEVLYSDYIKHRQAHDALINYLKDLPLDCGIVDLRYRVSQVVMGHIKDFDIQLLNGLEMQNEFRNNS